MDNKQFTWAQDAEIKFTGNEFGAMLNGLKIFLNEPLSPNSFILVSNVYSILDKQFQEMVKQGIAKEQINDSDAIPVEAETV